MAMASGFYGITLEDSWDVTALAMNLDSNSVKLALVMDAHTPDFNAHDTYADLTNELTGTGYTAGGNALDTPTWATSGGYLTYDTDDEAWSGLTTNSTHIRGGVGYNDTVSDRLLWATTLGADYQVTGGTFTWQVNANGHFRFDIVP